MTPRHCCLAKPFMHFFSRSSSFLALGKRLNALRTRDLGQPRSLTSPAIRASVRALGCIKHESPMPLRAGSRSKGPAPQWRRRNQHRSQPMPKCLSFGLFGTAVIWLVVIMGVRVALPQDFLCAVRATFQISQNCHSPTKRLLPVDSLPLFICAVERGDCREWP